MNLNIRLLWERLWGVRYSECCGGYCGGVCCPGPVWQDSVEPADEPPALPFWARPVTRRDVLCAVVIWWLLNGEIPVAYFKGLLF